MSVHFTHQLEHLDLIASAPEGVKRLRELILELAVRGKLVPQDPNDEPASELLKRIQAEKAKLVTEGRIKKDKPLAEIGEKEKPFNVPEGWEWTRLATVSLVNPRNDVANDTEASFVPMAMIGTQFEGKHQQETRKWGAIKQGFTHFAEGDIGVAKITPCFENSKACVFSGLINGVGAGTTELHIVRPVLDTLSSRYVLAYLKAPQFLKVGEGRMTGTAGQKRLPKDFVEANPFPLPPLAEQHRIVAKVNELMALCDRLEAQQTDAASAHTTLVKTLLDTLTLPNHLLSHASAQRPDRSGRPVRSATGPGSGHDQTPISPSQSANDFTANWRRLAQHFDTLITTEASVTALKQTLLQLAVMGKLVPQDPNDEPASELLKRIQAEKAKLVAEGKIKKDKPLPVIGEEQKPVELPVGWEWATLDSISSIGTGATPLRSNPSYFQPDNVAWVTSGETGRSYISGTTECVSELAVQSTNLTVYPVGTLIVAMYGQGKTRGQISELLIEATTNQACAAIVPILHDACLRKYIKIYFWKIYDEIREEAAGGAQPNLNVGKIKARRIPLPPLPEQHRIVAKVDELMALCDHLASRLKAARELSAKYATVVTESALESAAGHAAIA